MVFSATVGSDFEKLVKIGDTKKTSLIDFAGTDFLDIRTSLIKYIKAVYPLDYHNFSESDMGMMLIELVSYMGAVLSHKADHLAHENYLQTARNRNNIRKLLALVGVRIKGPISAVADASLEFKRSPTFGAEGGTTVTIAPSARVITVNSPEDSGPLNFTLYKVVNGALEDSNNTGNITLLSTDADNPSVATTASSVYTNLAMLEGSLVTMEGNFNNTEQAQRLSLAEGPVVERSTQVYVSSVDATTSGVYTEVDNIFFASGETDKIYQVVYDDDFNASILFGDGIAGVAPPLNSTYFITYRIGGGRRGNIPVNFVSTDITATDGADLAGTLTNSTLATGGSEAESVEHAKKYAPLTFRSQDRLVTLYDYTAFANTYVSPLGAAAKAKAVTRKAFSSANVIDIYVLEKASESQLKRATSAFKKSLLQSIDVKKMATDEIVIVDGLIRTLDLVVTAKLDKHNKAREEVIKLRIRDKIIDFFNVDNFNFGKDLSLADLNRAIFELQEVRFSSIDNLAKDVSIDFNEIIQLNNLAINIEFV